MAMHLSDVELVEIAEAGKSHPHLAECDRCRREFEDARAALALARADRVPEPSPLFWEHFSARVQEAVGNERMDRRLVPGWLMLPAWRPVIAVALVVLFVGAIVWRVRPIGPAAGHPASINTKSTKAAQPFEHANEVHSTAEVLLPATDPSLAVIARVTAHLDASRASEAGIVLQPGAVDRAISQLTPSEQQELIRLLQADPDGPSF